MAHVQHLDRRGNNSVSPNVHLWKTAHVSIIQIACLPATGLSWFLQLQWPVLDVFFFLTECFRWLSGWEKTLNLPQEIEVPVCDGYKWYLAQFVFNNFSGLENEKPSESKSAVFFFQNRNLYDQDKKQLTAALSWWRPIIMPKLNINDFREC